jgi:hypothetical protein
MSTNLKSNIKSTYIYTLASFDNKDNEKWMQNRPLIEIIRDNKIIELMYLSDIHFNFVEKKGNISKISLYRIKIDKYIDLETDDVQRYIALLKETKNFYNNRAKIFETNNFSNEFIDSLGFEKLVDFNYLIDPNNNEQIFDNYSIKFSYHVDKETNSFYLDCPLIRFSI